jgi:hypothetical protein
MAREQYQERQPTTAERAVEPAEMIDASAGGQTKFVTTGTIPPVETATATPKPTASELAYGRGPGVQALEAMLAKGTPKPGEIVSLIDAHRDEHNQMLALVSDRLGAAFAESVRAEMSSIRASISRKELVAGDPNDPNSNYLLVSQKEQGARFRAGDLSGTANKNGLDAKYNLDQDDALHLKAGKDKSATLAWEHDGKNQGEAFGKFENKNDYEAGVRKDFEVGKGTLTAGAHHKVDGDGTTDGAFATYKQGGTTIDGNAGVRDGSFAGGLSIARETETDKFGAAIATDGKGPSVDANAEHKFGNGLSVNAQGHAAGDGLTGSVGAAYENDKTKLDGNVTRATDKTSLHLGGSHQLTPEQSVSGTFDYMRPDSGQSQATLGLSERYKSGKLLHGLDLELGHGARDYAKATGSVDGQFAPNLYGGAWGSTELQAGHHASAQLGASLTFTTHEKYALTAAGIVDQDGNLETRLQFDVFKSKIESIGDLDKQKKDAMLSLFLSYSKGSNNHMLDQRFGEPQIGTNAGNQVTAGIKIRF